jgi:lysophospholipid acyltransferase (LPLAT)-like uncharacterized protein
MIHQIGKAAVGQGLGAVSLGRVWRKFRHFLRRQPWLLGIFAAALASFLRFTNRTNPQRVETRAVQDRIRELGPVIIALWHGQHLMASFVAPREMRFVALFSRSADAEMNAIVAEKLGVEVVRGSGGRETGQRVEKGGARALIQLKRALDEGKSVVMIADISKSTPRQAGEGIALLAKISGRPILPAAYASSRGVTVAGSWDKMRINLPFGRAVAQAGEPLFVPREASETDMAALRRELTARLNEATSRAYALAGGAA